MKRSFLTALFILMMTCVPTVYAQDSEAARNRTRESLAALLERAGPRINVAFRQSTKNPYNYVGSLTQGLVNAESLEIVISVTKSGTIGFRVYPHYKNGYININKVKNSDGVMRKLLWFSDQNFLFWGADDDGDIFSGYTVTLESGFPDEAIVIVLRSIPNTDKFIGQMRPNIDGTNAP